MAVVAAAAGADPADDDDDWPPTLLAAPLAEAFAAAVFVAELFRTEPLDVELLLAAGFAVIGLDFSGLGLAELPGVAPELAMLAAVVVAPFEAVGAFVAGAVPVAVAVPVVAAVVAADWPAAAMGTGLVLAVVGLPVVGLPDIAPPSVLIATGLLVG